MSSAPLLQVVILTGAVVVNIILAIFVYKNNPKSATNKIFGLLGGVVSVWLITMYLAQSPTFLDYALLITRATIFFATPMNVLFFLLAKTIPLQRLQLSRRNFLLLMFVMVLTMLLALSPYGFAGLEIVNGKPVPIPGVGLGLFGLVSVALNLAAVYVLLRKFKKALGTLRQQLSFVMLGMLVMFGLIIVTIFVPVFIFSNASFVPLAPLYTLTFLVTTAYAIIKYRLLEIRPLLARAVGFIFLFGFIAIFYTAIIIFGFQKLFGFTIEPALSRSLFLLMVVFLFAFDRVRAIVQNFTNKFFFRGEYSSDKLISVLTRVLAETIDLDEMTERITRKLTNEMALLRAAFLIVENNKIVAVKGVGYNDRDPQIFELERLFHESLQTNPVWLYEDLTESHLKDLFRALDIALVIPMRVESTEVALLVLGPKLSGETFYQRDIELIQIIAPETGIAIQNAKSYSEIKKFSKELEARVVERTHELEVSQKLALAKAGEIAQLKDEFVFLAVHELRTPVTAIRGFLELTGPAEKSFPKDVQHYLSAIAQASEHMNQLINDLLQVARSESGALDMTVLPHDFQPILDEVLSGTAPLVAQRGLTLKQHIITPLAPVLCDPTKTKEVLLNLVSNAIKYNREKGTITITVARSPDERSLLFEISDTGYGIPKEQQEKVFQKFFRAGAQGTQQVLGTGLGLFITRMLVQKMGGTISFSSVPQEGTTFAFSLPFEQNELVTILPENNDYEEKTTAPD